MDEQSAGHIQLIKSGAYSLMVCHFHASINGCLRCNKMAHRITNSPASILFKKKKFTTRLAQSVLFRLDFIPPLFFPFRLIEERGTEGRIKPEQKSALCIIRVGNFLKRGWKLDDLAILVMKE